MLCYGAALTMIPTMAILHNNNANRARKSVYFPRKTKMADGGFLFYFCRALLGRSVFEHVIPSRTLYGRCSKCCEGFVAIWLRAREEFAYNRFQCTIAWCHMVPHLCPLDNNMHLTQWADYTVVEPKCSSIHESS